MRGLSLQTVRQAAELIAGHLKGNVTNYYFDYGNHKLKAELALLTPLFQRGMELRIENGELKLIGDPYGHTKEWERLKALIEASCKAVIWAQASAANGFQLQNIEITPQDKVLVDCVA